MVDWFPTLCGLAGLRVPRSIEGQDRSEILRNNGDVEQGAAFIMNFSKWFDWFENGAEWRGVRTNTHTYARWLDGREQLYDLQEDPFQMNNLAGKDLSVQTSLQELLAHTQSLRNDELVPCKDWKHWLDEQRRVIKNAYGPLSHPESEPDWSLLH